MKRLTFVMDSPEGLHVTEAGPLVKTAQQYPCRITLSLGDKIVDAKKMLSVLRLGAKYGDRITATFDAPMNRRPRRHSPPSSHLRSERRNTDSTAPAVLFVFCSDGGNSLQSHTEIDILKAENEAQRCRIREEKE